MIAAAIGEACNLFWLPAQPLVWLVGGGGLAKVVCVLAPRSTCSGRVDSVGYLFGQSDGILFWYAYTHGVASTPR